jgi:RNA polymerase sigma-70 factor (ECF subfamily)
MLLAGFAAGDPRASLLFVRRFERTAIGVAMAVVHDHDLAEDVGQQAFVRAWSHAETYDPRRGSVRAWMTTIVRNLAVDMMRVRRPYPLLSDDLEPLTAAMTSNPGRTPEGQALERETSGVLRRALAALPPEQARAVVLASVQGYSASQVADLESIPLGTAKSQIRCGLIKLREAVATTGDGRV